MDEDDVELTLKPGSQAPNGVKAAAPAPPPSKQSPAKPRGNAAGTKSKLWGMNGFNPPPGLPPALLDLCVLSDSHTSVRNACELCCVQPLLVMSAECC